MEQTIRKNYKQVKKTKGDKNVKPSEKFVDFFKNLDKEEQIKYYEKFNNKQNLVSKIISQTVTVIGSHS